jgi:phosphoribosylformylglycinamidine synthase
MLTDTAPVWGQYDHQLFLNTVAGPGGDATVLRLRAAGVGASAKGLALSSDGNHRWCASDPRIGTRWVVAESTLNLACVGALPLAMVNCLNFGNPEHPEVMWQLSQAVDGLAEAAKALSVPVVGGNVSLYNESDGEDIDPTPVVLTVGLVEPLDRPPPGLAPGPNQTLLLVGPRSDCLVGSALAVDRLGRPGGSLPEIDLTLHLGVLHLLVELVRGHKVEAIHDVSDGGLAVTLAEMARAGRVGVRVDGLLSPAELFAETPSRVVVATTSPQDLETMAAAAGVPTFVLGSTDTSEVISVPGLLEVTVGEIDTAARGAMAGLFGVPARPDIAAAG